ncbi:hypothetical protein A3849_28410 [Paenibacillus sp. P46E]|nr:hypothetical protein A3849_28410 [Paenibacillus sp. P46E]
MSAQAKQDFKTVQSYLEYIRQLMRCKMVEFICHICGYAGINQLPWGIDGKTPSFDVCACCGAEYGIDDLTKLGLLHYQAEWLSNGGKWFNQHEKPNKWDLIDQMRNISTIEKDYLPYYFTEKEEQGFYEDVRKMISLLSTKLHE